MVMRPDLKKSNYSRLLPPPTGGGGGSQYFSVDQLDHSFTISYGYFWLMRLRFCERILSGFIGK